MEKQLIVPSSRTEPPSELMGKAAKLSTTRGVQVLFVVVVATVVVVGALVSVLVEVALVTVVDDVAVELVVTAVVVAALDVELVVTPVVVTVVDVAALVVEVVMMVVVVGALVVEAVEVDVAAAVVFKVVVVVVVFNVVVVAVVVVVFTVVVVVVFTVVVVEDLVGVTVVVVGTGAQTKEMTPNPCGVSEPRRERKREESPSNLIEIMLFRLAPGNAEKGMNTFATEAAGVFTTTVFVMKGPEQDDVELVVSVTRKEPGSRPAHELKKLNEMPVQPLETALFFPIAQNPDSLQYEAAFNGQICKRKYPLIVAVRKQLVVPPSVMMPPIVLDNLENVAWA